MSLGSVLAVTRMIGMNGSEASARRRRQTSNPCLVGLLVEGELAHGARLVPAGVVVVAGGVVQVELHVVVRPDPLGRIDHAPLQVGEDPGSRNEDRRAARLANHLVAEARANPHLEALEVTNGVDLLPEPTGHLG
jgi:hypothetical protein